LGGFDQRGPWSDGESQEGKRAQRKLRLPAGPIDALRCHRTPGAIPFEFRDHLGLVDWTGRATRPDKRGFIPQETPKILGRVGTEPRQFIEYSGRMLKVFGNAVGAPDKLVDLCAKRQTRFLWGLRVSR